MSIYRVRLHISRFETYEVEADSADDAALMVIEGEGELIDSHDDFPVELDEVWEKGAE